MLRIFKIFFDNDLPTDHFLKKLKTNNSQGNGV